MSCAGDPSAESGEGSEDLIGGVLVLTLRTPVYGASFGADGVKYSGLLRAHSSSWPEVQAVKCATVSGTLFSSDVPELVLAASLVADIEKARASALSS